MTEPLPPLTDEELSAVLDDEAGPEVVARVQADPAARARLDALAAAGTVLRNAPVPPLEPADVDRLVARSLGAASDAARDVEATPDEDDAGVTNIAPAPRRGARAPRWLAAAAIVALVSVGLGLIWSGQRSGDDEVAGTDAEVATQASEEAAEDGTAESRTAEDDASAGAEATDDGAADEPDASPEVPAPHGDLPSTTTDADDSAGAEIADLGVFDGPDELRALLRTEFPDDVPPTSGAVPESPTTAAVERCRDQLRQVFELETLPIATGFAIVAGQPVLVYEFAAPSFQDGSPTTLVAGVGSDACNSVLTFER
ncbi:hypothetical protein BH20ACT3_BH20ACT3_04600 [soil metagenome]